MYAVVRTGGRQYRVEEGRAVRVGRLPGEPGDTVELAEVLLMGDGETVTVGAPTVDGARVLGTIAEQGRAPKVVVFRYKAKTRSRKKTGHRQAYTRLIIEDILAAGQKPKPKAKAETVAEPEAEAPAEAPKKRSRRKAAGAAAEAGTEVVQATPAEAETEKTPEAKVPAAEAEAPPAEEKPKRTRRKKADTE